MLVSPLFQKSIADSLLFVDPSDETRLALRRLAAVFAPSPACIQRPNLKELIRYLPPRRFGCILVQAFLSSWL
jgi:hypothetical protein